MPPNKQPPEGNAVLFNQYYPEIKRLVAQRRSKWVLSSLPFEDVSSILETRIWKKIHLYDVSLPFDRWCNTLITNAISSLLRDLLLRHARPCLSSGEYGRPCCFNGGDNICNWHKNPTGIQNAHCPLYAEWEKKKGFRADISAPLSLESHVDEHHNKPSDFVDYDRHKAAIDKIMVKKLTKGDAKIYRLIYIKHWPMPRVLKELKMASSKINKTPIAITKARNRFIKMARSILAEFDFQ